MKNSSTLVSERIAALLKTNSKGQVGIRDQLKKLDKKLGAQAAQSWLDSHKAQTLWAQSLIADRSSWAIGDTETTGFSPTDEVIELAIVRGDQDVLIDTYIKPTRASIKSGATNIHGISGAMVSDATSFELVAPELRALKAAVTSLGFYNKDFDTRLIAQSAFAAGLAPIELPALFDPMPRIAAWIGDYNPKKSGFKWAKLEGGHRALGDVIKTIEAIELMATSDLDYVETLLAPS